MFTIVNNDAYIGKDYRAAIKEALEASTLPVLAEAPFSINGLKEPLEAAGVEVECVFIIENAGLLSDRYFKRENKSIPQGHLTRQRTFAERAEAWGCFSGTSEECLNYLRGK